MTSINLEQRKCASQFGLRLFLNEFCSILAKRVAQGYMFQYGLLLKTGLQVHSFTYDNILIAYCNIDVFKSVFFILMFKSHCFKQWLNVFATMRQLENIIKTIEKWWCDQMRILGAMLYIHSSITSGWNGTWSNFGMFKFPAPKIT